MFRVSSQEAAGGSFRRTSQAELEQWSGQPASAEGKEQSLDQRLKSARRVLGRLLLFVLGLACGVQVLVCVGEFIEPLSRSQHALHLATLFLVSLAAPLALGSHAPGNRSALSIEALLAGSYALLVTCRHLQRLAQSVPAPAALNATVAALSLCAAPMLLAAWALLVFLRRGG